MRKLGDKATARAIAEGGEGAGRAGKRRPRRDEKEAVEVAKPIGYPVLVKATAGAAAAACASPTTT